MANTRERVKDFPSIVGTIQSDDYIPVDGATQGVRKAQVKDIMDAPITGLDTIANTTKGAINELATTAGKVWVGTQDEYDDLPDTKLTDNVLHCITDGEPSAYDSIWDKVGTDPLDTTASDCSGAINELKQSLLEYWSTSATPTVPAGTSGDLEFAIPATYQSGYRVVSYAIYSGSKVVKPYVFEITPTKITYYVENTSGSSIARQITIKVLFQKV